MADSNHPLESRSHRYQQIHGRQQDRLTCELCGAQLALGFEAYAKHFHAEHAGVAKLQLDEKDTEVERNFYRRSQKSPDVAKPKATHMPQKPETGLVSEPQIVAETKGIYKGIVLLESKCIEVDGKYSVQKEGEPVLELSNVQWQTLSALHGALLHEHHDFFLATEHPSASPPLKRLASKYSMAARMWRHGIHSYMETWIECLGDLARYRMAIEDDNIHDRKTWADVSCQWYKKASDLSPGTGRVYHHLAILARPNWLHQLLYYSKSLCVPNPFESARVSILTLIEPLLDSSAHPYEMQQQPIYAFFVRCHACMFMRTGAAQQRSFADEFLALLHSHVARTTRLFLQPSYAMGIANCCAMVEYGSKSNAILQVIDSGGESDGLFQDVTGKSQPTDEFLQARALMCETARLILNQSDSPNVWPFVHVTLVFVYHLSLYHGDGGMVHLERPFPWAPLVNFLNALRPSGTADPTHGEDVFPGLVEGGGPPLPEDFTMRGLLWAGRYHPDRWMEEAAVDDEDKTFERASMAEQRRNRILWLGRRIAACGRWIACDEDSGVFSVAPGSSQNVEALLAWMELMKGARA